MYWKAIRLEIPLVIELETLTGSVLVKSMVKAKA